jgi:hypothetical protein
MGLLLASNAVARIVAPPAFGAIFGQVGHDVPWYLGAALLLLVIVFAAWPAVRLSDSERAAA